MCMGIVFIDDNLVATVHELPQRPNETPEEYRLRRRRMLIPKLVGYFKMNSAKAINQLLGSEAAFRSGKEIIMTTSSVRKKNWIVFASIFITIRSNG